jgi:hypothetical protein
VAATDAAAPARAAPWTGDTKERLTMINHGIHAALAHERMSTFLAQAEADRLAMRARRPRRGRKVRLRDGLALLIRPVRPADDGLLADGFAAALDHHDHEALGALDHARRGGVGIALEYEVELD